MKLSTRALCHHCAGRSGHRERRRPDLAGEISRRQDISLPYLEQLFVRLRRAPGWSIRCAGRAAATGWPRRPKPSASPKSSRPSMKPSSAMHVGAGPQAGVGVAGADAVGNRLWGKPVGACLCVPAQSHTGGCGEKPASALPGAAQDPVGRGRLIHAGAGRGSWQYGAQPRAGLGRQPGAELVGLVNRSPALLPPELATSRNTATFIGRWPSCALIWWSSPPIPTAMPNMPSPRCRPAHVFVEKPLATTVADARRVVEVARDTGRKLVVGCILRTTQLAAPDRRGARPWRPMCSG